jgi:D-aminoacyl-tRNA deacylase
LRTIIQRVSEASVSIEGKVKSAVGKGMLILFGVEETDDVSDVSWLAQKICNLRIFPDNDGVMNLSVKDVGGEIMIVSQFTLFASTRKGNRPSYIRSAKPDIAVPAYELFIKEIAKETGKEPATGEFGADMKVALINDGPVTILIDTKNRE